MYENNFIVDAKIEIIIKPDVIEPKKEPKKRTKKTLTKKQKNELKLMMEQEEIRSMDGDDNIYN